MATAHTCVLEVGCWDAEGRVKGCLCCGGHLDGLLALDRREFGTKWAGERIPVQKGLEFALNSLMCWGYVRQDMVMGLEKRMVGLAQGQGTGTQSRCPWR